MTFERKFQSEYEAVNVPNECLSLVDRYFASLWRLDRP